MGLFSGLGRAIIYPIARPFEQIKKSSGGLRDAVENLRKVRAERVEAANNPILIQDQRERFAALYEKGKWTEEELSEQLATVILTKRIIIAITPLGFILGIFCMFSTQGWPLWLLAPIPLFFSVFCLMMVIHFTVFQTQIQERSLKTMMQVISMPDFWKRVFT